jgi:4-diphosphocytidyl-2C-methyl-D-erythritol kinase
LLLPFGVDTAAVYRAWDRMAAGCELPSAGSCSNDLEAPALRVEPRLARWRTVFEQATGRRPRLAGSGSTWFVEGGPDRSGVGGRQTLRLGGEQAQLVPVRTIQPARRG